MKRFSTNTTAMPSGPVGKAFEEVSASFERFCLAAGVETLGAMLEKDAEETCGPRHARGEGRRGYRWGRTRGKSASTAGKWSSSVRGCAILTARNCRCRAGNGPARRIGWVGGRWT